MLGVLRVQVARGAKRCDVMRFMCRHVCALRACPDRTSAPETSVTRLAWGELRFHTFRHVITQAEVSLISFVLSPHCVWSNITSRVQEVGVRVIRARV